MFQIHIESRRALLALMTIMAVLVLAGILAALIEPLKVFMLITLSLILPWALVGWGFGWRTWLAGLATLTGATAVVGGDYFMAGICGIIAILFLFGTYVTEADRQKTQDRE